MAASHVRGSPLQDQSPTVPSQVLFGLLREQGPLPAGISSILWSCSILSAGDGPQAFLPPRPQDTLTSQGVPSFSFRKL